MPPKVDERFAQQISSAADGDGKCTYNYYLNGNMTAGMRRAPTWTSYNKLAKVQVGTQYLQYQYDFNHSRATQTSDAGDVTTYRNDPTCSMTSASTRGFTGEEMLDGFCLINVNGHIYHPVGRHRFN